MFLADQQPRPVRLELPGGWHRPRLFLGKGTVALEVVVIDADKQPGRSELSRVWRERHGGPPLVGPRAEPILSTPLGLGYPMGQSPQILKMRMKS